MSGVVTKPVAKAWLQFLLDQSRRQKYTGVGGSARKAKFSSQRDLDGIFHTKNVPGFDLRSSYNTTKCRQIANSSSVAVSSSSRKAVGIAIYRNINMFTDCNRVNIEISGINLVNGKVNGIFKFILGCAYIHSGTALADIKLFMLRSLLKYSKNITKKIPDYDPDLTTPIMIVGDFNVTVSQGRSLTQLRALRVQFVLHRNFSNNVW
ncbi:hypothetical protein TNCV_4342791 [Trichonephila clavipes]|nr:hypothetical protein TNCV_4342791 [Trichonephila clavipes]